VYPVLFRIGSFEVTTFGVLVAIGALVGLWLFRSHLPHLVSLILILVGTWMLFSNPRVAIRQADSMTAPEPVFWPSGCLADTTQTGRTPDAP